MMSRIAPQGITEQESEHEVDEKGKTRMIERFKKINKENKYGAVKWHTPLIIIQKKYFPYLHFSIILVCNFKMHKVKNVIPIPITTHNC